MVSAAGNAVKRGCHSTTSPAPANDFDANTGTGTIVVKCKNEMYCNKALLDITASKLREVRIVENTSCLLCDKMAGEWLLAVLAFKVTF